MSDIFRDFNIAFRSVLIKFSEYTPAQVLKAAQVAAPTTPDNFLVYDLAAAKMEPYTYQVASTERVNYLLTYHITIYGDNANAVAASILQGLQTQAAKDILQPNHLAYKSANLIANTTEYINNKGYNRADINAILSAVVQRPQSGYIDKVIFDIKVR